MATGRALGAGARAGGTRLPSIRSRFELLLDLVLLIGFAVAYTFNFTGLEVHEWFGLFFGATLILHLSLHWDWVARTTAKLLRAGGRRRVLWLVNLALALAMFLCVFSGVMVSVVAIPWLGLHTSPGNDFWTNLHRRSADLALGLVAIHVGLDWRWVTSVTRRWVRGLVRR